MKPKVSDFVLAAAVVLLAAAIWIIPMGKGGTDAHISQGDKSFCVSLSKNAEYELRGCVVAVRNGEIFISETDCPDRVCEKTGKISKAGEAIICIPNEVVIEIAGERELDAVAN